MDIIEQMAGMDHEQIVFCRDRDTGLQAIIAIHDTRLGPGLGGIRIREYASQDAALMDVLRLSRAMTYKNACAGLDYGGAKSVLLAPVPADRQAAFRAFGRILDGLNGRYVATEDMGVSESDIAILNEVTEHAVGRSRDAGGSGDPSAHTAEGVFVGMRAALRAAGLGTDFAGIRVAVQGCGSVGLGLIQRLHAAGATVVASDPVTAATHAAVEAGASIVPPGEILFQDVDVVAPCAVGATLDIESIPRLQCRVVAGCANNQLAEEADADRLAERGILYAPDFVINAGGVINVAEEQAPNGYDPQRVASRIAALEATLDAVFAEAADSGRLPSDIVEIRARRRLAGEQ